MDNLTFINELLKNRHLSVNDRSRLMRLALNEMERTDGQKVAGQGNATNTSQNRKPAPKDTAAFLSLFNDPKGFKFLTHDFDPDADMTYEKLVEQSKQVFKKAAKDYSIPQSLFKLIQVFLGKEDSGELWIAYNGEKQYENYGSKSWKEWADKNPGIHPMSNPDIAKTINLFRSTVRVVGTSGLDNIVREQQERHPDLQIITEKLRNADFYTYVYYLEEGIRRILDDMSRYPDHKNIRISYRGRYAANFSTKTITITQLDSEARSFSEVKSKFDNGGGAFNEIKDTLSGFCNWSVESKWAEGGKRWNILNDSNEEEVEDLPNDYVIEGFTHILTYFYK